jgi:cysteine desulfurase / selenocysteine lyase
LCRQHDVRFCVDAIQAAGAIDIDVKAMGIDFLSAGGPKWLMGPIGAGIFYVRRGLIPTLQSGHHGWLSTAEMDFFRHDLSWSETATRFEAGTLPWPSLHGLNASAETLLEVGIPNIERHVLSLGEMLIEGLEAKDYTVATPQGRGERGGIISFTDPRRPPADVVKLLDEHRITVSARGPFVRVSPHFYNNTADIERLLAVL